MRFGEWIVSEEWSSVKEGCSASEQAEQFEKLIKEKLNTFCPEKQMKLGSQDKLFISAELKRIARLKNSAKRDIPTVGVVIIWVDA